MSLTLVNEFDWRRAQDTVSAANQSVTIFQCVPKDLWNTVNLYVYDPTFAGRTVGLAMVLGLHPSYTPGSEGLNEFVEFTLAADQVFTNVFPFVGQTGVNLLNLAPGGGTRLYQMQPFWVIPWFGTVLASRPANANIQISIARGSV